MHIKKASRIFAQREAIMTINNLTPETRLRRRAVAEASTAHGYPIKEKTLATMASRGGGPPYQVWGRIPIYTWGPYLDWAQGRLSEPRSSTSEADAETSRPDRPPKPAPIAAPAPAPDRTTTLGSDTAAPSV
jgi:hypothetical protein